MSEQLRSSVPKEPTGRERLNKATKLNNSNMGLEEYMYYGDIKIDDLKGDVLDLGSGDLDRFSREATRHGIKVTSLDPHLVKQSQRNQVKTGSHYEFPWHSDLPWTKNSVAGLAQELPFKAESFDTIVASASAPGYLDPRDYDIFLKETNRVLRPGGKAYLFPLFEVPNEPEAPYNEQKFLSSLKQSGLKYALKDYQPEGSPITYRVAILSKPESPGQSN
ncbi:class I SAM-dependent methyltransferase [Candidatus Saccharibacteria bacterium]|nr:class I SAM-dependent methyltransferase [Candidatus Saccharibacteria bacterium]